MIKNQVGVCTSHLASNSELTVNQRSILTGRQLIVKKHPSRKPTLGIKRLPKREATHKSEQVTTKKLGSAWASAPNTNYSDRCAGSPDDDTNIPMALSRALFFGELA
jgi:hypothetical protein